VVKLKITMKIIKNADGYHIRREGITDTTSYPTKEKAISAARQWATENVGKYGIFCSDGLRTFPTISAARQWVAERIINPKAPRWSGA
jgi:hypothetical protein